MSDLGNMEFIQNWENETSVSRNDNIEVEKKDELPTRLIPGYTHFDDYLQVCLLVRIETSSLGLYSLHK